jgi:2-polyprenyl-6-hydroxyphenyl methylase / 3-demethylubiquinone-9 3-methyltransferase
MSETKPNVDRAEIAKFDAAAARWWDTEGPFRTLHEINPLRLDYIDCRAGLAGKTVVDVGCGGGILSEAMALRGARVTGIDLAESSLAVARMHVVETRETLREKGDATLFAGAENGSIPDGPDAGKKGSVPFLSYRAISAEALAAEAPASADIVTCMELLEHVPNPAALVEACARLVRPGGHVFLSTINRNPKSYLYVIIGAEYLLRMLPAGTHDYARFIRPSELAHWLRAAGLDLQDLSGLTYNPLTGRYAVGRDVSVNYLMHAVREG